ncbi:MULTISPECIES: hypothetical protein [Bradyrhizobium]|uniref:hypothetical protein n=1 Tax=Bradyrhizobium TaxID=374 RepID=UPI0013E8D615|nr:MULTISPECIES: hypothetical protein [Bradyrhizobium]
MKTIDNFDITQIPTMPGNAHVTCATGVTTDDRAGVSFNNAGWFLFRKIAPHNCKQALTGAYAKLRAGLVGRYFLRNRLL